ncbi:MAG: hemolysin III family protein [Kiritimatiellae bacterium]|jgi:hemolysin III|nr:hemolysin III family protein [Kiritimatiellia bacterium]
MDTPGPPKPARYEAAKYTLGEEIANAVTHGVGAALGIAGLSVMAVAAARHGAGRVVPCVLYGSFMVLMFLVSTLYHSLTPPRAKRVFRVLDHEMIFLMIAGTYTPMMLLGLGGAWGWSLFGVVWGLAVAGLVFQGIFTGRFKLASTLIYVLMGWVVVIAFKPLVERVPAAGIRWLAIGGVCYTLGAVVYLFKKIPYHHAVWHLAVLGGAICHFFAILWYVLPPDAAAAMP